MTTDDLEVQRRILDRLEMDRYIEQQKQLLKDYTRQAAESLETAGTVEAERIQVRFAGFSPESIAAAAKESLEVAALSVTQPVSTEVSMSAGVSLAARRRAVIQPILDAKGWSVYRWEKESGVTSKVGQRYLDGATRTLRRESSLKLSNSIELAVLPN
jgi:hypothetical protein